MTAIELNVVNKKSETAHALSELIGDALNQGKKVLWLISGGSSVQVAVAAFRGLGQIDTSMLSVALVDDVYGVEEADTNWFKLQLAGFDLSVAQVHNLLTVGNPLKKAGANYAQFLTEKLAWADYAIGQFGLGAGFHTGGIQPQSTASRENRKLAIGYRDGQVDRITITPALIARLDVAFINSTGEEKRPLVEHFLISDASIGAEPTQALKQAKRTILISDVLPN